ncbi:bifunctional adenosylcobinamide kinase/adenosylcobinamide-phosphate guanylyltransferase [Afifella sp. IM 167]|uniref:bifunctional adenosylcobinamide kinase/adenosylcobinamide-phosphate guanylyltransferase n=1 Tax=Afifella sp. IM 167 TaxID=2033586 RepID=UPI001CCC836D|nr:bifunctional adenosylcobinamide kinase/adenosylcobinamide-phosphate guanylyltransferase [Afifella sp. IM 167]MBZ8132583.1 bifunctional adenosylcobinamide kinase/adenosylcobinamide-phosphate guanylyltransferase [Afifella sp. IM 167]
MSAGATLVLGGARSGKSLYAERMVTASGLEPVYVATYRPMGEMGEDAEMEARIAAHRSRRGPPWRNLEAPVELAATIRRESGEGTYLLVDCLTLWLTNLLLGGADLDAAAVELTQTIGEAGGSLVLVANEVGLGIVPENALARRFRDAQGRLNQDIAAVADTVVFMAAGLPMAFKGKLPS